jgi:hypothetical protein
MFRSLEHHEVILTINFKNRLHVLTIKFNVMWNPIKRNTIVKILFEPCNN